MKKTTYKLFFLLLASGFFLTSCTKDLKEDARKMNEEIKKLKAENDSLLKKSGQIEYILGVNEPIAVKTTLTDDKNKQRSIEGTYRFKMSGYYTQSMTKNADGTYYILIRRFIDAIGYDDALISFVYNPSTKAITSKTIQHYWTDAITRESIINYDSRDTSPGLTFDITLKSIDVATGQIALTAKATATGEYTENENTGPYPGQPISTTLSFEGKLEVFIK